MRREKMAERQGWAKHMDSIGFTIHEAKTGNPYWSEDRCYVLSPTEIDELEVATNTLHQLCRKAVAYVVEQYRAGNTAPLAAFDMPEACWSLVAESWERQDPEVYGRFDLCFDGKGPPKLYEYNADTPTSLYEAAVVQYLWLKEVKPDHEQWNMLHDALIAAWAAALPDQPFMHFMGVLEAREDFINLEYLRDTCAQAGCATRLINISALGYDKEEQKFTDGQGGTVGAAFKLYPWEWLVREGDPEAFRHSSCRWVEAPWKMLLSNKALFAAALAALSRSSKPAACFLYPRRDDG
jgi:glutathionylspermidine synthase